MPHQIVVISDHAVACSPHLDCWLPSEIRFSQHQIDWESSSYDHIKFLGPHLIIAFAGAEPVHAAAVLRSLRQWPLAVPLLAVLPSESNEDLLQVAADTADDFIFWPPRQ